MGYIGQGQAPKQWDTYDKAEVYTKSEVDTELADIPKTISKTASNVLLSGNIEIANTVITKSNANVTYTGNGSTQDIVTGIASVDFTQPSNGSGFYHDRVAGDCIVKNDAGDVVDSGSCVANVSNNHWKARSQAYNNFRMDGLRGMNHLVTNNTNTEASYSEYISSFNSNGVTIGSHYNINELGSTYILHQTLYTHIKWGLTNQGKRYITAYNPVTREVMTMYQGSGIVGHQIPNPLGIKLDYLEAKTLDNAQEWTIYYGEDGYKLQLGGIAGDDAKSASADYLSVENDYVELSGNTRPNGTGAFISYGFANSETKIITQYQGTGQTGNFVETKDVNGVARRPRRVIIKRTDGISNWGCFDTARYISSGKYGHIELNTSDSEGSVLIDINSNGMNINSTSTQRNESGGQYIAIVEFDNGIDTTIAELGVL